MVKRKNAWGLIIFLSSVPAIPLLVLLYFKYPPSRHFVLHGRIVPVLGLIGACLSFLIGHFSYPRVQNLKVYLAGYSVGLASLAYFGMVLTHRYKAHAATVLLLLVFINWIIVLGVPSFVKYRSARSLTFILTGLEALVLAVVVTVPRAVAWAAHLERASFLQPSLWIGIVWIAAVVWLSYFRLREEFHLGGIIAGSTLFYAVSWCAPGFLSADWRLEQLLLAAAPLYLETGTLVHWFSRMEHRISYDPLLHIYNRNYCSRIIAEQSNVNTTPPFGVAMIDIDRFKKVNDTYGHQAGDMVLYTVAQTILHEVVPYGIACRYGGEEIIVFFPRMTSSEIAPFIENIRSAVEGTKIPIRKKKISVTISCGISHRDEGSQKIIDVIHSADKALYRAKNGGRNLVKTAKTTLPKARKR